MSENNQTNQDLSSPNAGGGASELEMKELLKKNLELSEEILAATKKIKNYMVIQRLVSIFYFIIIVGPIILSIIFLPPLIKNMFNQYTKLLDGGSVNPANNLLKSGSDTDNLGNLNNVGVGSLLEQIKNLQLK